ncbi:MAG: SHD1 domain-containing protein [Planctomycetota bacterium]
MTVRLVASLLAVSVIAGCGGSSDGAADVAARAEAARKREQRLEEETSALLKSVGDVDDLEKDLASRQPEEKPAHDEASALRKWTDTAGRVLASAEFVSLLDGNVCLEKEDGGAAVIPIEDLCQADQDYVKTLGPESASEPDETVEIEVEEAGEEPSGSRAAAVGLADGEASPPAPARQEYDTARQQKVVIPFDFVSKFDNGRYGQMVGDMVWKKLEREGGFIIPDTMLDVRDLSAANNRKITPDSPLAEVAEVVRKDFDADVAIWGSVERAPGAEWEIYDLVIKCVDFSAGPEPKIVYEVSARTNSVSEIPHLYVKQMLDKLYDRKPGGPPPIDQLAEENWKSNANLVEGADFEQGSAGVPRGWDKGWEGGFVDQYEPLGNVVKWIAETGNTANRVIRFTMDQGLADSTGVPYYSKAFPIEDGAKYRFQCRWRSNGPTVKVFIKCYDEMGSRYAPGSGAAGSGARRGSYVPESAQLRECYRSQQNLSGPIRQDTWNTHTQDFTPKHTKYTPRWGKVELYAYHPAGVVEFDDVVLKQIVPASPSESAFPKDRRHSLESGVTIKEMEENERRGSEARERLRGGPGPDEEQRQWAFLASRVSWNVQPDQLLDT